MALIAKNYIALYSGRRKMCISHFFGARLNKKREREVNSWWRKLSIQGKNDFVHFRAFWVNFVGPFSSTKLMYNILYVSLLETITHSIVDCMCIPWTFIVLIIHLCYFKRLSLYTFVLKKINLMPPSLRLYKPVVNFVYFGFNTALLLLIYIINDEGKFNWRRTLQTSLIVSIVHSCSWK